LHIIWNYSKGNFTHTSFVISWGIMPVFAGAAIQSNTISIETIILSAIAVLQAIS